MWSLYIYRALYTLLHCIFTVFEQVYNAFEYVNIKIVDLCHEFLLITKLNKHLHTKINKLSKTPVHLTVILGSEKPSYKDLANLVIWCLATHITFISFYDHKGILKKNEDKLQEEVNRRKSKQDHVIWHEGSDSTYKNGYIGQKIHLKIITEEDGRAGIVNLTKRYAPIEKMEFSVEDISQDLCEHYEFPDPDMGIVCGEMFSLYGYPPWQVRVTEFFHIKSHRNISFSSFVKQLVRYNKCEQRLGK